MELRGCLDLAVWEETAQPENGTPCRKYWPLVAAPILWEPESPHTALQGWDLFPQEKNCKSLMNTLGCVAQ